MRGYKTFYGEGKMDNFLNIRIKYLKDIDEIKTLTNGDWIDLRAAEDIKLKKGEFKLIPLGVAMQLPENYEAHIAPRSSTFKKYKIIQVNSVGIVDNSYSGDNDEWMMPVYAMEDTVIPKNDRICQFRIMERQPNLNFDIVDILGNENRGGFGSTGDK